MQDVSPYSGVDVCDWKAITDGLLDSHPLEMGELAQIVLSSWDSIFASRLGTGGFQIGKDIFPKPQIMGFLLHELIPLELAARYPNDWRVDKSGDDKDLVYVPDSAYSIEIKTSSHRSQVFGNRSYAQPSPKSKKSKAGYYLAVNFEKFRDDGQRPSVTGVRFGWLDHSDWIAQRAATGQQARLAPDVYGNKLIQLFGDAAKS